MVRERESIHGAMNRAAGLLITEGFDAMIVSDDDCFPPFDAIPRLLKHYEDGHHYVCGLGFMRGFPHTTTIGRYYPEGVSLRINPETKQPELVGFYWVDDFANEPPGLISCDFAGVPIAMISRDLFLKVPGPWFGTHMDGGDCTHDVYFGAKVKAAGFDVLVDRDIACDHLLDPGIVTEHNRGLMRNVAKRWDKTLADDPALVNA
jgi:hypothetical protein